MSLTAFRAPQSLISLPLAEPWALDYTPRELFTRGVAPLFCTAGAQTLTYAASHPLQRQALLDELAQEDLVLTHPSLLTRPLHELWDGSALIGMLATQGQVLETNDALHLTLHFEMAFVREPWRRQGLAKEMVRAAAGEALALVEGRMQWLSLSGRSIEITLGTNDASPAGQALFDIAEEMIALAEDDAMVAGVDFTLLNTRGI